VFKAPQNSIMGCASSNAIATVDESLDRVAICSPQRQSPEMQSQERCLPRACPQPQHVEAAADERRESFMQYWSNADRPIYLHHGVFPDRAQHDAHILSLDCFLAIVKADPKIFKDYVARSRVTPPRCAASGKRQQHVDVRVSRNADISSSLPHAVSRDTYCVPQEGFATHVLELLSDDPLSTEPASKEISSGSSSGPRIWQYEQSDGLLLRL
jgi:hypothetical protein